MVRLGFDQQPVIGSGRHHPFREPFIRNRLTSDSQRFNRTLKLVEENPGFSAAKVTYGWLSATYHSIDALRRNQHNDAINIPMLIAMAGSDRVVSNTDLKKFLQNIKQCEFILINDSRHEILQERDSIRSQFWRAFDAFIER
jgi:lysophospholipase